MLKLTTLAVALFMLSSALQASETAPGGPGVGMPPIQDNGNVPTDPAAYHAYMTSKYNIPQEMDRPDSWDTLPGKYMQYTDMCEADYEMTTGAAVTATADGTRPPPLNYDTIVRTANLAGVPLVALQRALNYVETNPTTVKNRDYVCVMDYTTNKDEPRMWTVNLGTGESVAYPGGHGRGPKGDSSDNNSDGIVDEFSNIPDSFKSSTGCILTGLEQKVSATVGPYYELHGINDSNSNNCPRRILGHGQPYQFRKVNGKKVKVKRPWDGTSAGCISTTDEKMRALFAKCGGGGIICTNP